MTDEEYSGLIQPYEDALKNIRMRVEVLNEDFRRKCQGHPIHHTQFRIKEKESIEQKLTERGFRPDCDSAMNSLTDIAGLRVICYFIRDIYSVVSLLKRQSDIVTIKECDYIKEPKKNGYRSFHIVFGVPIYYIDGMQYFPVEIQLRTMAMDLWASMEHRLCYKGSRSCSVDTEEKLRQYAGYLEQMERNLEEYFDERTTGEYH